MAEFTKGPWMIRVYDGSLGTIDSGDTEVCIAQTHDVSAPDIRGGRPIRNANARLIAAAPDLYEALEEMIGLAACNPANGPADRQAIKYARDVLARVKGEGNEA